MSHHVQVPRDSTEEQPLIFHSLLLYIPIHVALLAYVVCVWSSIFVHTMVVTITSMSIFIERIPSVTGAGVSWHCVGTVLITHTDSLSTFINICGLATYIHVIIIVRWLHNHWKLSIARWSHISAILTFGQKWCRFKKCFHPKGLLLHTHRTINYSMFVAPGLIY